jgi:tyrosine-protein kinase Etk/Wzc
MDTEDQIKQSEIDLIDYIKIIYKRWWIILIIVFASMFHTAISSLRQPKMYEAYATFFPLSLNQNAEESEVFFFKPQIDIRTMVISLLDSRKMTDRVIEELDLRTLWNISSMTETRKMLKSSISITLEKIGIIRLAAQSDSPELAAKIANAYVDNLDYFNQQLDIGPQKRIVQMVG